MGTIRQMCTTPGCYINFDPMEQEFPSCDHGVDAMRRLMESIDYRIYSNNECRSDCARAGITLRWGPTWSSMSNRTIDRVPWMPSWVPAIWFAAAGDWHGRMALLRACNKSEKVRAVFVCLLAAEERPAKMPDVVDPQTSVNNFYDLWKQIICEHCQGTGDHFGGEIICGRCEGRGHFLP